MKSKDKSGPAFPTKGYTTENGLEWATPGMTLRDWFAGQALMGQLAVPGDMSPYRIIARCAYEYADAMIEARDAQSGKEG